MPTGMITPQERSRSRQVLGERIIHGLWLLLSRRSTCIRYRRERSRLRFRWYLLRLHRFLRCFLQEHRSLRLRRHRRLRCFLHRLGRPLRLRHGTSSPWEVWDIRREIRVCRWEGRWWMGALGLVGGKCLGGSESSGGRGANGTGSGSGSVPRQNSLRDLKIPARVSQEQVGL